MIRMYTIVKKCSKFILSSILLGPRIKWGDRLLTINKGDMYVDIDDNRGKKLISNFGVIDWMSVYLWNEISKKMNPKIYVDIGANYGEVCLSRTYSDKESLYAFEPNEEVFRHLKRSVDTRSDKNNINLKNKFVGIEGEKVNFVVDRKWSGTSSGINEIKDSSYKGRGEIKKRETQKTSVDIGSVVNNRDSAILKLDVEGAEKKVLEGNIEYISSFENIVVIMEINSETNSYKKRNDISSLIGEHMSSHRIKEDGNIEEIDLGRYRSDEDVYFKEEILLSRGDKAAEALKNLKVPKWFLRLTT